MEEKIEITKREYKEMKVRLAWLDALEAAGVDNWSGWDLAHELRKESELENM